MWVMMVMVMVVMMNMMMMQSVRSTIKLSFNFNITLDLLQTSRPYLQKTETASFLEIIVCLS